MADATDAVAEGERLRVELRGLDAVNGQVMWKSEGRLGIAFDDAVDPRRAWKTVSGQRLPAVPHGGIQRHPGLRGG